MSPELEKTENAIQGQRDRLYRLAGEKKPVGILQIEYKRAVELMAQKFQLLTASLDGQKAALAPEAYETALKGLKDSFKNDIVSLAVAVDEAAGLDPLAS